MIYNLFFFTYLGRKISLLRFEMCLKLTILNTFHLIDDLILKKNFNKVSLTNFYFALSFITNIIIDIQL